MDNKQLDAIQARVERMSVKHLYTTEGSVVLSLITEIRRLQSELKIYEDHYEYSDQYGYSQGCICGAEYDDEHIDNIRKEM